MDITQYNYITTAGFLLNSSGKWVFPLQRSDVATHIAVKTWAILNDLGQSSVKCSYYKWKMLWKLYQCI